MLATVVAIIIVITTTTTTATTSMLDQIIASKTVEPIMHPSIIVMKAVAPMLTAMSTSSLADPKSLVPVFTTFLAVSEFVTIGLAFIIAILLTNLDFKGHLALAHPYYQMGCLHLRQIVGYYY